MLSTATPGLYRGFVLSTPKGHLTQGRQAALIQFIQTSVSEKHGQELRLVLEGRKNVSELTDDVLAELRKLTAAFLAK